MQGQAGEAEFSLEDLTLEEQEAFKRLVDSGRLSHLVAPWEPWWLTIEARQLTLRPDGTRAGKRQ